MASRTISTHELQQQLYLLPPDKTVRWTRVQTSGGAALQLASAERLLVLHTRSRALIRGRARRWKPHRKGK